MKATDRIWILACVFLLAGVIEDIGWLSTLYSVAALGNFVALYFYEKSQPMSRVTQARKGRG